MKLVPLEMVLKRTAARARKGEQLEEKEYYLGINFIDLLLFLKQKFGKAIQAADPTRSSVEATTEGGRISLLNARGITAVQIAGSDAIQKRHAGGKTGMAGTF